MPALLVKNVPDDLMRELKRLKVELGCKTWVELLEKLVERRRVIVVEEAERTRGGCRGVPRPEGSCNSEVG
ncbi:MAG: hypothetical protein QXH70_04525 [Thermofilaceae archaeon]